LWSWGYNYSGALGQNNTTSYSSPVQTPGTTWSAVTITLWGAHAVKTDGTFWSWGYNNYGQAGKNNLTKYSSPVQVPGTTWATVESNNVTIFGVKTDNTLWGWGNNGWGGLAQNNTIKYSSPVQIPGTTWAVLGGNALLFTIATKTDGTLWSWGNDSSKGALGQNNQTEYSSPTQIPGTTWSTDVSAIAVRSQDPTSLAIKTDGTLWSWGYNINGQLGNNATANQSSPIQIGSDTTWYKVYNGRPEYQSGAIKKV
jgi:alpha-tubulin suppressor-like RCC1 family protein